MFIVDVFAVILSKALNLTITEPVVVFCGILDFSLEVLISFSSLIRKILTLLFEFLLFEFP